MANRDEFLIKVILDDNELKVRIPGLVKDTNNLSKAFENVTKSSQKYNKTAKQNKQVNDDMISSAGLAGATLTEFGRTISDLPFGITAITNNLSQLGTLFTTLVAKTGGTTKAFSLLGRQLAKGPLGIILIFQVLISLLQQFQKDIVGFIMGVEKANEATKKLRSNFFDLTEEIKENNKELGKQDKQILKAIKRLEGQVEIINRNRNSQRNANKSLEEFNEANQSTLNLIDQRVKKLRELGVVIDETRIYEEGYIESLRTGAGTLGQIGEELNQRRIDIETQRIQGLSGDVQLLEAELDLFIDRQEALNVKEKDYIKSEEYQVLVARIAKAKSDAARKALQEDLEISSFLMVEDIAMSFEEAFRGYFDEFKDPLVVDENLIDADAFIEEFRKFGKIREEISEKTEIEILNDQEKAILKRIDNLSEELKAVIDVEKLKTEVTEFFSNKRFEIIQKEFDKNLKKLRDEIEDEGDKLLKKAKKVAEALKFGIDAITAQIDAEISQEERKTTLINNELKKRIINEKLTAEQKEAINNQIERNEVALQEKRDKLAEKAFKAQKAVSIAEALINTYEMAVKAYKALSGIPIVGPALGFTAAAAATVFGLKQVDAIRKTQFVPSAAPGSTRVSGLGGAGATGGGRQDPTFNIVGTGQQFQLSQAIAQRTGEPVKAYVVTGDVRSGLALERNIIKGSKLG